MGKKEQNISPGDLFYNKDSIFLTHKGQRTQKLGILVSSNPPPANEKETSEGLAQELGYWSNNGAIDMKSLRKALEIIQNRARELSQISDWPERVSDEGGKK